MTELTPTSPTTSYLTSDTLGSPRVVTDSSGAVISRRDFMPFGEEIAGLGGRTSALGYQPDAVRQKFTSYERDDETDLDFAKARYLGSNLGRFTTPDPLLYTADRPTDPQKFNLYVYVRNNPLNLIDLDGKKDLVAVSVVDGKEVPLTPKDRIDLQKNLRKLAPGTSVDKSGKITFTGKADASAGTKLISKLINSEKKVTIVVDRNSFNKTDVVDANGASIGRERGLETLRGSWDSKVTWNPDLQPTTYERSNESPTSSIIEKAVDPAITLGHELIHSLNLAMGNNEAIIPTPHVFSEGNMDYSENLGSVEQRAVGYGYNEPGDITENDLRKQLGMMPRAAYLKRSSWIPMEREEEPPPARKKP